MKIDLAQIISSSDPERNLDLVDRQVALAAFQGAEVVVFPEATMRFFGGSLLQPPSGRYCGYVYSGRFHTHSQHVTRS